MTGMLHPSIAPDTKGKWSKFEYCNEESIYLHAPSVIEAVYRNRCHRKKDSGRPNPDMRVQNSQSLSPFLPAMNLHKKQHTPHP